MFLILYRNRNRPSHMFLTITFSKMLCNIQGKTPVLESVFNKVGGLKVCNFIKKIL